jgi:pimeloyl-ACP methyl ester carboxylesterase
MKGALELYDIISAKTPNVRMLISQGGGHFLYRVHPEEFNQNLMNFIDFWNR